LAFITILIKVFTKQNIKVTTNICKYSNNKMYMLKIWMNMMSMSKYKIIDSYIKYMDIILVRGAFFFYQNATA